MYNKYAVIGCIRTPKYVCHLLGGGAIAREPPFSSLSGYYTEKGVGRTEDECFL